MPDDKIFHCSLITPDRVVLECEATFAALTSHDGEVGFLNGRAPLLCNLGIGELRVKSSGGDHRFFLDGGFAQMLDNNLTVLTERAEAAADIDVGQARTAFDEAIAAHADELTVARARARRRIAESTR